MRAVPPSFVIPPFSPAFAGLALPLGSGALSSSAPEHLVVPAVLTQQGGLVCAHGTG